MGDVAHGLHADGHPRFGIAQVVGIAEGHVLRAQRTINLFRRGRASVSWTHARPMAHVSSATL